MKKIIIVLASALIVFVGTLVFTDRYVTHKLVATTDSICNYVADDMANDFGNDTQMSEEAVSSFLSGNFICKRSATGEKLFILADEDIPGFSKWFNQDMQEFLEVNPYFNNAIFMIDEGICQRYKKYGYKSSNTGGGEIITGSMKSANFNYDFMHANSYNTLKTTLKSQWRLPSQKSPMKGKIVSYYVPVSLEDGSFFGVFVLNLDIKLIRDKIILHLPYGEDNSQMIVADQKDRIIASYPQEYESYLTMDSLRKSREVEYTMYKRTLKGTNWTIYTFNNPEAIYRETTYIFWVMVFISGIGMLLMLLCCLVIFRQIRKDLRRKAAAEEELKMAAKVQLSLLKPADFAFIKPAKEAGGDLYDYVEKEGNLVFCIGDVSGKGMPAALFMTQVVSLFRNAVRYTQKPAEIVSQMNDVLAENNTNMTFCTFFCGVLDTSTRVLTFCNAGHNQPVLLPECSYLDVKPNLALGLMGGYNFKQETLTLKEGESLLLYTDGVTEAKNRHRKCFGDDHLLTILKEAKGTDIINEVLHSITSFVNGYEQSDDITMVYLNTSFCHKI